MSLSSRVFALGITVSLVTACSAAEATARPAPEDPASIPATDRSAPVLPPQEPAEAQDGGLPSASCKAVTARAKVVPLHLVAVLDRSQSMVLSYTDATGRRMTRLQAIMRALTAYAALPQRSPVLFSAIPFGSKRRDVCDLAGYSAVVTDALLPNTTTVPTALDDIAMTGVTPTSAGVRAGTVLAQMLRRAHPDDNVVLLLATDGLPTDCGGMSEAVVAVREASVAGFPTHVVGIGEQLANLSDLARAGGTGPAVLISGTSASAVASAISSKLEGIRSQFSCEVQVPATQPDGRAVVPAELNVQIAYTSGARDLVYSQACALPNAFRYDDAANPKKVVLCGNTCDAVRADDAATVDLLFNCATRVQ